MEGKKKVKSISSAAKDKVREDMSNAREEQKNYDNYVSDMEIIRAYENKSKNRLKVILAFILGIIATIALFSTLGLSSSKGVKTNTKNTVKEPAYIGILMVDLEDADALDYYDLDDIETILKKGVVVETVKAGGPAQGYLKKKDIITKINRKDIENMDQLKDELAKFYSGQKVVFTVERDGRTKTISMILGSK